MGLGQRIGNLLGITLPFAGFVVAMVTLWGTWFGTLDLALLCAGYLLTGVGITVGYHRLFTHRAFRARTPVKIALGILGSMAVEGPVCLWVADHRKHHQFSDTDGDPHSPHLQDGAGVVGSLRGFAHAHVGWLLTGEDRADVAKYAPDLLADRGIRTVNRLFGVWVAVSLLVPTLVAYAFTGTWRGALMGLIWGGAVRIFVLHQVTFSINSVCHMWGRRRFHSKDESRNVSVLSLLSFGESWHNNHHAFPSSAFHGLARREALLDPGGWVIVALERLGLASDVVRIGQTLQERKLIRDDVVTRPARA